MRSTKIIKICSSSLCTCLHHMVILRTRNKITDFLMILAWASPFKYQPKCVQPRFSPSYRMNKISIQCTRQSVFLYEIKKLMKINAIKHQHYISRLSPQMPPNATVCRLFIQNFAGEVPRKPPPPPASQRALHASWLG